MINGTTTYPSHLFGRVSADSFFNWSGNNTYGFSRDLVGSTSNDYSYGTSTFNTDGSISISFSRYDAKVGNIIVRYMLIV